MDERNLHIAFVFESDIFDRKGLFNAVHGRIRALLAEGGCTVEAWCIQRRNGAFLRRRLGGAGQPRIAEQTIDGIRYRLLWYRFSLLDYFCVEYLHLRPFFFGRFLRRNAPKLRNCDLVSAHSLSGGLLARESGIPFFITWHGSDIHTRPARNPLVRRETRALSEAAAGNFYVSEALMAAAAPFPGKKFLLRNGVDERFRPLSEEERKRVRARLGLPENARTVAYAGHFFHVKNTLSLPDIWHEVRARWTEPLLFLLIGDGKEAPQVRARLRADRTLDWIDLGNRAPEEMPGLLGCIDVLVLPSFNEGLPLIAMEARRCGCSVVGARVGGIPEVIGTENCVAHGPEFSTRMAEKVVDALKAKAAPVEPEAFSWAETARTELEIYRQWLHSKAR